jgi:hypothetical protein
MLLAACIMAAVAARAQTTAQGTTQVATPAPASPFATPADYDPKRVPGFKPVNPAKVVVPPAKFVPLASAPASGAGRTGFDSTNSRKKKLEKSATKPSPKTVAKPDTQPAAPVLSDVPVQPPPSSYQRPLPSAAENAYASRVPVIPVGAQPAASITKRKRLVAEGDPYEPVGIRAGAFDLYPAVEAYTGYNTNPGATPTGKGSLLYTVAPELRAQSNWSRHELRVDLRGSYTYYDTDTTPSVSRPLVDGKVDGRVDITRDLRADLGGRLFVSTDYPNSPNLQAGLSRLPIYTTYGGIAGLTQRFNRFEIGVKGTADRTVWQSSSLVDGTSASNDDRNFNQYGGTLRAGYELTPGLTPYVEGGGDTRVHDLTTDFFGYQRNSNAWTGRVGSTFELSRLLTGDFSVGYTRRKYDDVRLEAVQGIIFDGTLNWSATRLTDVKLIGKTTVGESNVVGVPAIFYRDLKLQVDHQLRRWLVATVKFGFGFDTYPGSAAAFASPSDREDQRYSAGFGLTYKLSRELWLKGEVRRDWLHSNVTGYDYNANVFLIGLRLQR